MDDSGLFSDEHIRAAKIVREWWRPISDERQAIFEAFCIFFFEGKDPEFKDKFAEMCSTEDLRLHFPHHLFPHLLKAK